MEGRKEHAVVHTDVGTTDSQDEGDQSGTTEDLLLEEAFGIEGLGLFEVVCAGGHEGIGSVSVG